MPILAFTPPVSFDAFRRGVLYFLPRASTNLANCCSVDDIDGTTVGLDVGGYVKSVGGGLDVGGYVKSGGVICGGGLVQLASYSSGAIIQGPRARNFVFLKWIP